MTAADNGAAALFRAIGLMADGPVVWGRPVPSRLAGVFIVELREPLHHAPIELTRIGKWLERVPDLRMDGHRPSSRALAARMAAFWLPSTRVVYVGSTDGSIGGRVEAIRNTIIGERRPHSGGHWLHALTGLEHMRIWWSATTAVEEAEDALLGAFADTIPAAERAALHDPAVILPFANLRTATGERKATGLANSLVAGEPARPTPVGRIVEVAPGAAEGAGGLPPRKAAGGTVRRSPRPAPASGGAAASRSRPTERPAAETTWISAAGLERLQAERAELVGTNRPEVIGRIKAAKELGDLKENADYTAAREEQSFLEGRIAAIEATIRAATVIEEPSPDPAGRIAIGSTVTVQDEAGSRLTFAIVGSAEADPAAGRISNVSPVGRALIGRSAGEDVAVSAPRGEVRYRVLEVG